MDPFEWLFIVYGGLAVILFAWDRMNAVRARKTYVELKREEVQNPYGKTPMKSWEREDYK